MTQRQRGHIVYPLIVNLTWVFSIFNIFLMLMYLLLITYVFRVILVYEVKKANVAHMEDS